MKNLRKRIQTLMSSPDYSPLNKSEFARTLNISSNHRSALRAELIGMENKGEIVRGKKGRFTLRAKSETSANSGNSAKGKTGKGNGKDKGNSKRTGKGKSGSGALLIGVLRFQASGHAWFYPDANDATNEAAGMDLKKYSRIFIQSSKTSTAMNGDHVMVRIDRIGPPEWTKHRKGSKRSTPDDEAAGYVTKIISRGTARIIGTYFHHGKFSHVQPNDTKIPDVNIDRNAPAPDPRPKPGQIVAIALTRWDNPNSAPIGKITEVLGWPDTPGIDMLSIVHKYGLSTDFPDDVLAEAKAFGDRVTQQDIQDRDDWRDIPVITIDPHDAKDFDDAISVQKLKTGGWQLAVHIADVSYYVKPGTALDKEARARGNSTYMADRVLPMIPRELSNHLCSLMPNVDRLTQCCLMKIADDGKIKSARFTRAVINSGRRFTYEEAQEILIAKSSDGEISEMLREAWNLASLLRKRRFAQGALNLDMPEISVTLDDQGVPTGIEKSEYNESHQLIEEFMLTRTPINSTTTLNSPDNMDINPAISPIKNISKNCSMKQKVASRNLPLKSDSSNHSNAQPTTRTRSATTDSPKPITAISPPPSVATPTSSSTAHFKASSATRLNTKTAPRLRVKPPKLPCIFPTPNAPAPKPKTSRDDSKCCNTFTSAHARKTHRPLPVLSPRSGTSDSLSKPQTL